MLYRYIILVFVLVFCSCSSLKQAGQDTLLLVGEIVIDDEIYKPIIDNRNDFEFIESNMNPDDENIYHFDVLLELHNETVEKIAIAIETKGVVLYEDYKLDILSVRNQLEKMKVNYEVAEYLVLPDLIITLVKKYIRDYSRKQVAREFRKKFKYPVR